MKTKKKLIPLVEIVIVLCSVFLVAIPVIVAEQNTQEVSATASEVTTSSEDDYVLGVYGNANEDDTIDMGDVVYTKLAIFGKKPKTELCDAKYDGRINVLDVIQTKLIILGKEKELTIVDTDRIVTVKKPIERIVAAYSHIYVPLQILNVVDRIVGYRPSSIKDDITYKILYPAFVDIPSVGAGFTIDYEALLKLQPDLVFIRPAGRGGGPKDDHYRRIKEIDPDLQVVCLLFYKSYNRVSYIGDLRKLGYLLDKEEKAEEFIDYYEGFMDTIEEKVSDIPEKDKRRIYYEFGSGPYTRPYHTGGSGSALDSLVVFAGGKNIFSTIKGSQVSAEDVIKLDPEVIFKSASGGGYGIDDITGWKNVRDEIMNRPELQHVTAVKTGHVYVISSDLDCCGARGGRYFIAIPYIAKCLHPDIYLDPTALHQEFLTRFQGLDYDLDKHGVFVYHPEQFPEGM